VQPHRLCRYGGKEVLLVGFKPTTLTNWVNALTTELQSPYFSMNAYSIYIIWYYSEVPRTVPQYQYFVTVCQVEHSNSLHKTDTENALHQNS
jgi:hypothetical protein